MNEAEQVKTFGEMDKANLWAITILRDKHGNSARGYGSWPKSESPYGTEKGNSKFNMAATRSERQALDRLFPDTLPAGIEVADEAYIDVETGEIVEREPPKELEQVSDSPEVEQQLSPIESAMNRDKPKAKPDNTIEWRYEASSHPEQPAKRGGQKVAEENPVEDLETATPGPEPSPSDKFKDQIRGMMLDRFGTDRIRALAFLEPFGAKKLNDIPDNQLPEVYKALANLGNAPAQTKLEG